MCNSKHLKHMKRMKHVLPTDIALSWDVENVFDVPTDANGLASTGTNNVTLRGGGGAGPPEGTV